MAEKRKSTSKSKHYKRARHSGGAGTSKVEVGMRGVLISHDRHKEKFCRIDSFRLLNHFADELFGPESSKAPVSLSEEEDQDIENALKNEVTELKASAQKFRRFSTVKSGCSNLIFVKCKGLVPGHLVCHIIKTLATWRNMDVGDVPRTRDVLRMHPVDFTCPGYVNDMCKAIPPFLASEFDKMAEEDGDVAKEYTIEYKCRNNNHITRQEVLSKLPVAVRELVPAWKYNCRSQVVFVLIDIVKTVCMVSVVRDYFNLKKFNVREIFLQKSTDKKKGENNTDKETEEKTNQQGDKGHNELGDGENPDLQNLSTLSKDNSNNTGKNDMKTDSDSGEVVGGSVP